MGKAPGQRASHCSSPCRHTSLQAVSVGAQATTHPAPCCSHATWHSLPSAGTAINASSTVNCRSWQPTAASAQTASIVDRSASVVDRIEHVILASLSNPPSKTANGTLEHYQERLRRSRRHAPGVLGTWLCDRGGGGSAPRRAKCSGHRRGIGGPWVWSRGRKARRDHRLRPAAGEDGGWTTAWSLFAGIWKRVLGEPFTLRRSAQRQPSTSCMP